MKLTLKVYVQREAFYGMLGVASTLASEAGDVSEDERFKIRADAVSEMRSTFDDYADNGVVELEFDTIGRTAIVKKVSRSA